MMRITGSWRTHTDHDDEDNFMKRTSFTCGGDTTKNKENANSTNNKYMLVM